MPHRPDRQRRLKTRSDLFYQIRWNDSTADRNRSPTILVQAFRLISSFECFHIQIQCPTMALDESDTNRIVSPEGAKIKRTVPARNGHWLHVGPCQETSSVASLLLTHSTTIITLPSTTIMLATTP